MFVPAYSERPLRAFHALALLSVFSALALLIGCKEEVAPAAPAPTTDKTADPGVSR